jgi:four helix bundle protein
VTGNYPNEEKFGLIAQMRRSSSSIPTNIMEGSGRTGTKEFIHFIGIALGSCKEIEYQLLLSRDLGYLSDASYLDLAEKYSEIGKMLFSLKRSLGRTSTKNSTLKTTLPKRN